MTTESKKERPVHSELQLSFAVVEKVLAFALFGDSTAPVLLLMSLPDLLKTILLARLSFLKSLVVSSFQSRTMPPSEQWIYCLLEVVVMSLEKRLLVSSVQ